MVNMSTEKIVCDDKDVKTDDLEDGAKLKRVFGVLDASAHIIGGIIGSGIFVSPKAVLQNAGSPAASLIVWAGTGVISFLGALCYAQLALLLPESGSDYTYIKRGCGNFPAFLCVWVNSIFTRPASRCAVALTFSTYFCRLFFFGCPEEDVPQILIRIVAYLAISTLSIINCYRMNWVLAITDALTSTKIIALIIIIFSGLSCFAVGGSLTEVSFENISYENLWHDTATNPASYVFAFYGAFWAYSGFDGVGFIVEEITQPLRRNITLSVTFSIVVVIAVYVLTNFSYFVILSASELLSSEAVGLTFGAKITPVFFWLIPIFVAASTLGALNTSIINASREVMVSTRTGHLPNELSLIQTDWMTPIPSLLFNFILSAAYLWGNTLYQMILYSTYMGVLSSALSVGTLIYLKTFKRNDATIKERSLNLPIIIPIFYLAFFIICLIMPLYEDPWRVAICFAFIASGVPVYFLTVYPAQLPTPVRKLQHKILIVFQKTFLAIPDEDAIKKCS